MTPDNFVAPPSPLPFPKRCYHNIYVCTAIRRSGNLFQVLYVLIPPVPYPYWTLELEVELHTG